MNTQSIRNFGISLFIFIGNIHAYTQEQSAPVSLSLKQAVDLAIANNLDVRQSDLQSQVAGITKKQSRANLLPDLAGSLSHGINQGRSIDPFTNSYINQQVNFANYNLGSDVILFNGLQLQNTLRRNVLAYEASKMELQQIKETLTLNVILAYLQILNGQEQVAASQNQATLSRRQVERLETLNRSGAISPALLYDLQGQLATDELAIINNQNALSTAKLTLFQLMNVPFNPDLKVENLYADQVIEPVAGNAAAIYESALNQLALIKAVELRKQSAEKAVKAARGAYYPSVALSGNINTNFSSAASRDILLNTVEIPSGDFVDVGGTKFPVVKKQSNFSSEKISYFNQFNNNYSTSLSVGIRIPILNALRARNQVSLARIDLMNSKYIAENARLQLRQDVERAYVNMTSALDRYNILTRQVNSFNQSFKVAEVRFNEGASTQVDYLIAKNNLDRANINLINAKYDYILRLKVLDYYQGGIKF